MNKKTRLVLLVAVVAAGLSILLITSLYDSYQSARWIAARNVHRDSVYVGTRLTFHQIYTPPAFFRLPHWEVAYVCTNPAHCLIRYVTFSEIKATQTSGTKR
jgi:hypothetical protein